MSDVIRCLPRYAFHTSSCAVAGTAWYFQFFFYTMGESQMGRFGFSSWTLHMASIIIFGTCWGFAFREWKDAAPAVRRAPGDEPPVERHGQPPRVGLPRAHRRRQLAVVADEHEPLGEPHRAEADGLRDLPRLVDDANLHGARGRCPLGLKPEAERAQCFFFQG